MGQWRVFYLNEEDSLAYLPPVGPTWARKIHSWNKPKGGRLPDWKTSWGWWPWCRE